MEEILRNIKSTIEAILLKHMGLGVAEQVADTILLHIDILARKRSEQILLDLKERAKESAVEEIRKKQEEELNKMGYFKKEDTDGTASNNSSKV